MTTGHRCRLGRVNFFIIVVFSTIHDSDKRLGPGQPYCTRNKCSLQVDKETCPNDCLGPYGKFLIISFILSSHLYLFLVSYTMENWKSIHILIWCRFPHRFLMLSSLPKAVFERPEDGVKVLYHFAMVFGLQHKSICIIRDCCSCVELQK